MCGKQLPATPEFFAVTNEGYTAFNRGVKAAKVSIGDSIVQLILKKRRHITSIIGKLTQRKFVNLRNVGF